MRRLPFFVVLIGMLGGSARAEEPSSLTVFAAASLKESFGRIGGRFEAAHPGTRVRFFFAGSQELRTQLEHGARADVFASADQAQMDAARKSRLVDEPRAFATNVPVIVVPRGNPAGVRTLGELPRAKRIVLGVPEVPIGAYTLRILDRARASLGDDFPARVQAHVVSRELNVRQVLTKVVLGEADAAIVYRTDARSAAEKVETIGLPADVNVVAEYPVAVLRDAKDHAAARAFVELVLSPEGQETLTQEGFGRPAP